GVHCRSAGYYSSECELIMPTSPCRNIEQILEAVIELQPRPTRVLDIGIGYGKWGLLCKEYLGFWNSPNEQIQVAVEGIEAFPQYIGKLQEQIYDRIYCGNARDIIKEMPDDAYDLVLMIDVLEHFDKHDGEAVIRDCKRIGKVFIASTPSEFWPQED